MSERLVCPYYGKDERYCDVGCSYITPHQVTVIITYCTGRHEECAKYRELVERVPLELASAEHGTSWSL